MIKLYDGEASGNAYKARLMMALLSLDYESVPVNLAAGDNASEAFLALNPRGQIPVLVDDDVVLWDSQAVLVYLARRYGDEHWLPLDPAPMGRVMQWMALAENELLFGLARARAVKVFNRPWNLEECKAYGLKGLAVVEAHLAGSQWLAGGQVTIAEVACYPYIALARAGEVALEEYPAVMAWMGRIEALPGYVGMPGITPA